MGRRRVAVVLVLLVGGVTVGLASVGADGVPSTARELGREHHPLPALLYFALVTLVDTYLGWAAVPVLLGYWAARSVVRAAITGGVFALVALTSYTAGRHLVRVSEARDRAARDLPPSPLPLSEPSVVDTAVGLVQSPLLPMAVAGAALGALAGYHARRWPLLLLVLAAAVAVDMWRRADTPWVSIANGLPNVLLVVAGVTVLAWAVAATLQRDRGVSPATAEGPV